MSQGHSPLGFSGAERWRNCPGSVALIAALPADREEADPEYRRAGTAAHAAAAYCLKREDDAWMVCDLNWSSFGDPYRLTEDDVVAIQFYLDLERDDDDGEWGVEGVEEHFHAPEIHELAYGTIDYYKISIDGLLCKLTDYKHGEGLYVEVKGNWQLMGYAALLLSKYPTIERFLLRIVQPRLEGAAKVREWEIHAAVLREWIERELKPAMEQADPRQYRTGEAELKPGPWCRFCQAKDALACPALEQLGETIVPVVLPEPGSLESISDERLAELGDMIKPLEFMIAAVEAETLRRHLNGNNIRGWKTVNKRVFRVWKDTAEKAFTAALGPCVMEKPKLKSPAEMEKMGKLAKQLTAQYAFTPDAGATIARLDSPAKAITVQSPAEKFGKVLDKHPVSE